MGEVQTNGGDQSDKLSVRSYASEAAESLGVNRRTVERDLRRGKNIAPDVLAEVAGTALLTRWRCGLTVETGAHPAATGCTP